MNNFGEKFPSQLFLMPILLVVSIVLGLLVYSKIGPGLPLSVNQITTTQPAPFTATGEGKVYAKPDTALVSLGYSNTAPTVGQAQNQANQMINKLTGDLKNIGVAQSDIQTTNYSISPEMAPIGISAPAVRSNQTNAEIMPIEPPPLPTKNPRITGYNINISLEVKVHDFSKINQVIDTATADGANQVGALNFTLDNADQFRSQARKMAIDKAKQNAAELASQAGITLGKVVNVQESSDNGPRPYLAAMSKDAAVGTSPTDIQPGQTQVFVQVTLTYETR